MSKALYPEIARFKYKNKWVRVDIPIRIKLISMVYYVCPECKSDGKFKHIMSYIDSYNINKSDKDRVDFGLDYDKERRTWIPTKIMENNKISHCAVCLAEKDKRVRVGTRIEQMYKIYAQTNPEYLLLDEILCFKLGLNYRLRYHRDNFFRQFESFHEKNLGMKGIYKLLKEHRKNFSKPTKKTETCSLVIKKGITDEKLEEANYVSQQNKFVKKL